MLTDKEIKEGIVINKSIKEAENMINIETTKIILLTIKSNMTKQIDIRKENNQEDIIEMRTEADMIEKDKEIGRREMTISIEIAVIHKINNIEAEVETKK